MSKSFLEAEIKKQTELRNNMEDPKARKVMDGFINKLKILKINLENVKEKVENDNRKQEQQMGMGL